MDSGAVITNEHRFNKQLNADGAAVEISALQGFFNCVADWGLARVLAELQNDPEEEETEQSIGITPGMVQNRISGLNQHELPKTDQIKVTVGIDLGNFWSHWVKVAWFGNATGVILDYGIMETPGMKHNAGRAFVAEHLLKSLHGWRSDILAQNKPDMVLIDSGSGMGHSDAVYEFVRKVGGAPFYAANGS